MKKIELSVDVKNQTVRSLERFHFVQKSFGRLMDKIVPLHRQVVITYMSMTKIIRLRNQV